MSYKRYIEIVFDDSSSMKGYLNGEPKHAIAKRLFDQQILLSIALPENTIVLRLLRDNCNGTSYAQSLNNDYKSLSNAINGIDRFDKGTPLYYTIKDSIVACKNIIADEHRIFVLTDGGDTCNVAMDQIISKEDLKYIKQYNVNTLLVQFAIQNNVTANNLSGFAQYIGGTSVSIGSGNNTSFADMASALGKAIISTGMASDKPLPHCFENADGDNISWADASKQGVSLHWATLLFKEGLLSWDPNLRSHILPLQWKELWFLHTIFNVSAIRMPLGKAMLSKLIKPYYYSHDCIYWDFVKARWQYFPTIPEIKQQIDESVHWQDSPRETLYPTKGYIRHQENYQENEYYLVERNMPNRNWESPLLDYQKVEFTLNPIIEIEDTKKPITLKEGDIVVFSAKEKVEQLNETLKQSPKELTKEDILIRIKGLEIMIKNTNDENELNKFNKRLNGLKLLLNNY